MPVMSDRWIRRMAAEQAMIEPFVETQKRDGVISYGLSSYGYDARVADEFKIFTNVNSTIVDPKKFDALPDSVILQWRKKGWLGLVYAQLLSSHKWQNLVDLLQARKR